MRWIRDDSTVGQIGHDEMSDPKAKISNDDYYPPSFFSVQL
jgi:hypothetical protein